MKTNEKIVRLVEQLIQEGEKLPPTAFQNSPIDYVCVDLEKYQAWRGRFGILLSFLGQHAKPWESSIGPGANSLTSTLAGIGALKGIQQSLSEGLLVRVEDLVFAEVFSDLLEQAKHLFSKGYLLAAGVVGRAVLEERLRRLCEVHNCAPTQPRPTIDAYNKALYPGVYDKVVMKHVDTMATIGNNAAHAQLVTKEDIGKLLTDLEEFLLRFAA